RAHAPPRRRDLLLRGDPAVVAPDRGMSDPRPNAVASGPVADAVRPAARPVEPRKISGEGDTPAGGLAAARVESAGPRSSAGRELLGFMRSAVSDLRQTIVMVTHDPNAAAYADRVVFLADGHVVDSMDDPTAERIIDSMKSLGD